MARQRKLPTGMWKRGNVYYARFRANGRSVTKRMSTDYKAACDILAELKAKASRADFGLIDNDCKWDDLKALFLRWAKQETKVAGLYKKHLERFERYQPVRTIRQIDTDYVLGYRDWRRINAERDGYKVVSAQTINYEVTTLKNMLNKGVEWRKLGDNPIAKLKRLDDDKAYKERRALTVEEVAALLKASPAKLQTIWRLFLATGLRRSELVSLEFAHIDFDRRCLTVTAENAKAGKAREIPLDDESLAAITELHAAADKREPGKETNKKNFSRDLVFVNRFGHGYGHTLLRMFYYYAQKAGIKDAKHGGSVDLHSLRGTFATLAIANGASPKDVQEILGHSTLEMTMRVYTKTTERSKRAAIGAIPFLKVSAPGHVLSINGSTEPPVIKPDSRAEKRQIS